MDLNLSQQLLTSLFSNTPLPEERLYLRDEPLFVSDGRVVTYRGVALGPDDFDTFRSVVRHSRFYKAGTFRLSVALLLKMNNWPATHEAAERLVESLRNLAATTLSVSGAGEGFSESLLRVLSALTPHPNAVFEVGVEDGIARLFPEPVALHLTACCRLPFREGSASGTPSLHAAIGAPTDGEWPNESHKR